ncbi:hypothetical protein ACFQZJ_05820 [Maribacter chungangensis]|uniref:Uncharacterized protein n=1 Tax=Maribacter chungangensis TaxID=1069117 RepID=A0ABW3B106_9FLAO
MGYGKQFVADLGDGEDVAIYLVNAGLVFGRRKHHFECGLGIVNDFMKNKPFTTFLQPSGFVGYRIQNLRSTGPFDFRTGLGCPETLYVGLGLWF